MLLIPLLFSVSFQPCLIQTLFFFSFKRKHAPLILLFPDTFGWWHVSFVHGATLKHKMKLLPLPRLWGNSAYSHLAFATWNDLH